MLRTRLMAATLTVAALHAPCSVLAQVAPVAPWTAGIGYSFESYSFASPAAVGIRSLSLATMPLAARVRLPGNASLALSTSYAQGTLERPDGSSSRIAGPTDTHVQLDVPVGRDFVVLSAVAALPTGYATQTAEEAVLAGAIAADLLPFRVTNWGSGGGVGLATSVARSVAGFGVGLSAGYSMAREFEPLRDDERSYRPGNEARLRVVVDRSLSRSSKASLQLTAYRYADDVLGGQNLYRSGDRFSALGSFAFATGARASGIVYGGMMHRTEGAYLDLSRDAPAQDLILAGGGMRVPLGGSVLLPAFDLRLFRSADGVGQGISSGLGASWEVPLEGATLIPSLRGRYGDVLVREGVQSGFTGFDFGTTVRFGGTR